jgi:2-amino-4-hydroxy-6-hydroxymethyldihydropteridine diphosphokinase
LQALERLQELSDEPILRSSLWKTTPVACPPGSASFINAAIGLKPREGETPESLLSKLQEMEKAFGRRPKKLLNEERELDLDLIAFGGLIRNTERLKLPHPRAHERAFVLAPLTEIAADLVLPKQTITIRQLLEQLGPNVGESVELLNR